EPTPDAERTYQAKIRSGSPIGVRSLRKSPVRDRSDVGQPPVLATRRPTRGAKIRPAAPRARRRDWWSATGRPRVMLTAAGIELGVAPAQLINRPLTTEERARQTAPFRNFLPSHELRDPSDGPPLAP